MLQCERIKIIEEALKLAKAHPLVDVRMATEFLGFTQNADAVLVQVKNAAGDAETIRGSYLVSAEGARSIARKELEPRVRRLHLSGAHDQHRGRSRLPPAWLRRAQLHLGPGRILQSVSLEGPAGSLAHSLP